MPFDRSAALVQRNLPRNPIRLGQLLSELNESGEVGIQEGEPSSSSTTA